jgi:hypothetical protein
MISIKPVPRNAFFSIRDNLDPDSNITEESDLQQRKHPSPKTSIDEGILTNFKPVCKNILFGICFSIEPFSNTTNSNILFSETHSEVRHSADEGIHRMLSENSPRSITETRRMTPSVTINRGQNCVAMFQTTGEVSDLGFAIEVDNI